jgi:hypothetical protein
MGPGARLLLVLAGCALACTGAVSTASRAAATLRSAAAGTVEQSFDWQHGDGTVGWSPSTSSAATGFQLEVNPRNLSGLAISRKAADASSGDWAEWTYAAPGTTSIGSARLTFTHATGGLEHACISAGLRLSSGDVVSQSRCRPGVGSKAIAWSFDAPAGRTATSLFFRLEVVCTTSEPKNCAKRDAVGPTVFVLLSSADLVLDDTDAPAVSGSGGLWDADGTATSAEHPFAATLTAKDDGVGVQSVWLTHANDTIASAAGSCDSQHRDAALAGRPCAATAQLETNVSLGDLPDGPAEFTGHAKDAAGNVGSTKTVTVLVDRTAPAVVASGPSYSDGTGNVGLSLEASDADAAGWGSGVRRVWVTDESGTDVAGVTEDCTGGCKLGASADVDVDISSYADGTHTFVAHASDAAGNAAESSSFTLLIDRTPPGVVAMPRVGSFDAAGRQAVIRWDDATDSGGSGISDYRYRYSFDGSTWSDWAATPIPEFPLPGVRLGDVVDVEVAAIDGAGNLGATARATLTVFDSTEAPSSYDSTAPAPGTTRSLTGDQTAASEQIARADARVQDILGGRDATTQQAEPLSLPDGEVVGAHVTLSWSDPASIETDWPEMTWADSNTTYTRQLVHFKATGVTGLDVVVDLRSNEVVSIQPNDDAAVDPATVRNVANALSTGSAAGARSSNPEGANSKGGAINVHVINGAVVPALGYDLFLNWSYHHPRQVDSEGDWPIDLMFIGNADIIKAKDLWNKGQATPTLPLLAGPQYAAVMDTPPALFPNNMAWIGGGMNSLWDTDRGVYKGVACIGHKWHYRVWTAGGGSAGMYSPSIGYYVIGSAHQDHHDNWKGQCYDDWYGGSERAEHEVAVAASAHAGWWVNEDYVNLLNPDHRRWIGNRLYDNNGKATVIGIETPDDPTVLNDAPPSTLPQSTGAPSIAGTPAVGQTLTADSGSWTYSPNDAPAFTYEWIRCGTDGGSCSRVAPGPQYSVVDTDVGSTLRVLVTAKNAAGISASRSAPTAAVASAGGSCNTSGDNPGPGGGPGNDDFSHAQTLAGDTGSVVGTLSGGSLQAGENGGGTEGARTGETASVWYCFVPSSDGSYTFTTEGSEALGAGAMEYDWSAIDPNSGQLDPPMMSIYWNPDGSRSFPWHVVTDGFNGGVTDSNGNWTGYFLGYPDNFNGSWNSPDWQAQLGWTYQRVELQAGQPYLVELDNGSWSGSVPTGPFKLSWGPTRVGVPDFDRDGVPDASDNCLYTANADQANTYHGDIPDLGDACSPQPDLLLTVPSSTTQATPVHEVDNLQVDGGSQYGAGFDPDYTGLYRKHGYVIAVEPGTYTMTVSATVTSRPDGQIAAGEGVAVTPASFLTPYYVHAGAATSGGSGTHTYTDIETVTLTSADVRQIGTVNGNPVYGIYLGVAYTGISGLGDSVTGTVEIKQLQAAP